MARAAVLQLLRADTQLATLGGVGFVVEAQFSYEQRPNDRGAFAVICWRHTDFEDDIQANAEQHFDLYVHLPVAVSTDYGRIDAVLDRVDELFAGVSDAQPPVVGGDGRQLDFVGFEGRSRDLTDEGYQTICRYASYLALSSTVNA
jgi:hypothetical protein